MKRFTILLSLVASLLLVVGASYAQLPGDCDGSGAVDIDDGVFLISYLVAGGPAPPPAARSNCDCDNNPGISLADAAFIVFNVVEGFPPLFPPTGDKLTRGSRSILYSAGRADGTPGSDRIGIYIAVEPTENIDGMLIPFTFAPRAGEADISVSSVDFTGSVLFGSISAQIDNATKTVTLYSDPTSPPTLPGGTHGLLATVYFTQNAPGDPVAMLKTSTDRVSPLLFPNGFMEADGARVLYPGFVEAPFGDVDCTSSVDIDDVVALIGYIFSGGAICYW